MSTLRETLLRLREDDPKSVRGITVFYFTDKSTDNSTVYWIASSGSSKSPELHKLIEAIRLLKLELGCFLEVVHVPGLVLITQGTDGLSRGVWRSPRHDLLDPQRLTRAIFDPAIFDPELVQHYFAYHLPADAAPPPSAKWSYCDWTR
jgi:hypothetical protein